MSDCIGIRLGNNLLYRWEFERGDETIAVETPGPVTVDESHSSVEFGCAGVGMIYGAEPVLQPHFEAGKLNIVLED